MKYLFFAIFNMLFFLQVWGQKEVLMRYDADDLKQLVLNADEVFDIKISTSKKNEVVITSVSEGEYYNEFSLGVEMLENKMIISSSFPEELQEGYDKLSAHKVFSVMLNLEIPEGLDVHIESNIAAVTATGNFRSLQVQSRSGRCRLEKFRGNALVNTYSGSIDVFTGNASIEAISRSGKISIPPSTPGKYKIKLHSNTGDIRVREN